MRKLVSIFTMAALLAVLVPACDKTTPENRDGKDDSGKTDPTPTPTPSAKADYTILFYGIGGGDLDLSDEQTILDMARSLPKENSNVRIVVEYKYSSEKGVKKNEKSSDGFKISGVPGQVYRYEVTPSIAAKKNAAKYLQLPEEAAYGKQAADAEMFQPDSIASFIKYAAKQAPANQYIMFISGHGNGYNLFDDVPLATKATAYDDCFKNGGISMYQLKEGIKRSGVQLAVLGFQSCEMGQLEVVAELQGAASYMMASGHSINDLGYNEMLDAMLDGETFQVCMKELVMGSLKANLPMKGGNMNFSLTDLTKVGPFLNALKEITTYLCAHKVDNLNGYLAAAGKTYQYDQEDSKFDIYDYLYFLGKEVYSKDQEYQNLLATVKKTLDVAQPIHYNSLECKGDDYYDNLSYSVTLGAQGYLAEYSDKGHRQIARAKNGDTYRLKMNVVGQLVNQEPETAWDKTYQLTTFDKTVGWSKWFAVNPAFPRNNPPFYNYQTPDEPIDDDDEGDEGDE